MGHCIDFTYLRTRLGRRRTTEFLEPAKLVVTSRLVFWLSVIIGIMAFFIVIIVYNLGNILLLALAVMLPFLFLGSFSLGCSLTIILGSVSSGVFGLRGICGVLAYDNTSLFLFSNSSTYLLLPSSLDSF